MFNIGIEIYDDYEKNNWFYHEGRKQYTDNTIQELELHNGAVIEKPQISFMNKRNSMRSCTHLDF